MSNFATLAQEKVKSQKHFNGLKDHVLRKFFSDNINKERTHKNIVLSPFGYDGFQDFIAKKRKLIQQKNKANGTKNRMVRKRKNKRTGETEYQATCQEFIFSHSPGAMSEEASIRYLKLADEFLRKWYDGIEILSSVIHLDEHTPHLHFNVTYFDEERGKFCQSELQQQGKTDITIIREAWGIYLENTEFATLKMQDGSVVGKRKHERKASLEAKGLREEIEELTESHDNLIENNIVQSVKNGQGSDKEALARALQIIDEKDVEIGDLKGSLTELSEKIEALSARFEKLTSDAVPKESEVIDIREAIKETKAKVAEKTKKGRVTKKMK